MFSEHARFLLLNGFSFIRKKVPYLNDLIFAPFIETEGNFYCTLGAGNSIFINPKKFKELDSDLQIKVISLLCMKMNFHLALKHIERGKNKFLPIWTVACNFAIYTWLNKLEIDIPQDLAMFIGYISPAIMKLPLNLCAEEYYFKLLEMIDAQKAEIGFEPDDKNDENERKSDKTKKRGGRDTKDGDKNNQDNSGSGESASENSSGGKSSSAPRKTHTKRDKGGGGNYSTDDSEFNSDDSSDNEESEVDSNFSDDADNDSSISDKNRIEEKILKEILKNLNRSIKVNTPSKSFKTQNLFGTNKDEASSDEGLACQLALEKFLNNLGIGDESGEYLELIKNIRVKDKIPNLDVTISSLRGYKARRSFARSKKRNINVGTDDVLIPGLIYRGVRVGTIIDSSGSMSEVQLSYALGIINARLAKGEDITIYIIDCELQDKFKVYSYLDTLEIKGRGGTDIVPAYKQAVHDKNDYIIILSDGLVPSWPKKSNIPTIFCYIPAPGVLINSSEVRDIIKTVPEWISCCILSEHDVL